MSINAFTGSRFTLRSTPVYLTTLERRVCYGTLHCQVKHGLLKRCNLLYGGSGYEFCKSQNLSMLDNWNAKQIMSNKNTCHSLLNTS